VARKSSFVRFGSDYMKPPEPEKGGYESDKPEEKPRGESSAEGGFSKVVVAVLFLACLALAIGLYISSRKASQASDRLDSTVAISSLYFKGVSEFRAEDYEDARESLKQALAAAGEFQADTPDSYVAALEAEIKRYLAMPAISRGKLGGKAQKWADLRRIVKELEPTDIYLQLGEKAGPVLNEHITKLKAEELATLVPEQVGELLQGRLKKMETKQIADLLGEGLDPVVRERIETATMPTLRDLLKKRLDAIVQNEVERRKYDIARLFELLGDSHMDIVRNYVESAEPKDLAELVERRFDEIEREMAKKMSGRQAKITLDDDQVWEGQILHEGPIDYRFLRSDGSMFSIPKSRVKRVEPLLRPEKETEKKTPETPEEGDKKEE